MTTTLNCKNRTQQWTQLPARMRSFLLSQNIKARKQGNYRYVKKIILAKSKKAISFFIFFFLFRFLHTCICIDIQDAFNYDVGFPVLCFLNICYCSFFLLLYALWPAKPFYFVSSLLDTNIQCFRIYVKRLPVARTSMKWNFQCNSSQSCKTRTKL